MLRAEDATVPVSAALLMPVLGSPGRKATLERPLMPLLPLLPAAGMSVRRKAAQERLRGERRAAGGDCRFRSPVCVLGERIVGHRCCQWLL